MNCLRLTYTISGKSFRRELILDLDSQRWTARKALHFIVRHEFPSMAQEKMNGPEWNEEQVLTRFGISNLEYLCVQTDISAEVINARPAI